MQAFLYVFTASVDENLREQGLLGGGGGRKLGGSSSNSPLLTFDERVNRNKAISDIESAGFAQAAFKSSKSQVQCNFLWAVTPSSPPNHR